DIIRVLVSLRPLDKGITTVINSEETILCIFTLNFLTNLVGGNTTINIKGIKAKKYCRFCYIDSNKRGNLDYNMLSNS
ncbi:hypothetical protein BGZ57DRAFT_778289, partial [Hyaloscypha finlandica]